MTFRSVGREEVNDGNKNSGVGVEELADLPDVGLIEVLDFVRFLKSQLRRMNSEERFDRAWIIARRIAAEQGITDEDITAEIATVRQREQ
jgi:hypothetical protein